jgi:excisionase family DNA binding protein
MSSQRSRLTVVQRATAQAQSAAFTVTQLLELYLSTPSNQRDKKFVSTSRAAELAGVCNRTIQIWIDQGDLSAIRVGRNYKVSLDSLREYMLGINDESVDLPFSASKNSERERERERERIKLPPDVAGPRSCRRLRFRGAQERAVADQLNRTVRVHCYRFGNASQQVPRQSATPV